MRDGVSINEQQKSKAVIPYTEFMSLPDLSAYIKLPEDYPVTRITFSYKNIENQNMAFVPKPTNQNENELIENEGEAITPFKDIEHENEKIGRITEF